MNKTFDYVKNIIIGWQDSVVEFLPMLLWAILVFTLFVILARFAKQISLKFYTKTVKKHRDIALIIATVIYFFFIISGIFLALKILGLEQVLTKLLAGAGIVGIIAGFAFKDIASNLFAGLLLKFQQPFKKEDWVLIDGVYGSIDELGWITTAIKTVPGQEVYVPNQIIYSNTFTNYSTFGKRRIILETGVSYGDDLEHVRMVAIDEAKKTKNLIPGEDIDFYFSSIGASAYNFQLRFWIAFGNNNDYQNAMSDIIIRIKKRFEQENISIAYSVTTLDFGVKGGVTLFDNVVRVKEDER